jgi:drug/metabolite transporter (DMT)-like permease
MPYILAAILSNLSYAFADNLNGLIAKRNSPFKQAIWVSSLGVLIFLVPAIFFFPNEVSRLNITNLAYILGFGALVALGYLSFVIGMSKGSITLTGVIGGSFPAVSTLTALIVFGEKISMAQGGAIILILAGIVMSSVHGRIADIFHDMRASSLIYALGAFFLWGIYFALVRIPVERVGWFMPQYLSNVEAIFIYFLIATFIVKEKGIFTKPALGMFMVMTAILQVCGSMFFNYALTKGSTAIIAPIAGSSPAVFAVLAFFIFKEKLSHLQIAGIITALIGIISLSLLSS